MNLISFFNNFLNNNNTKNFKAMEEKNFNNEIKDFGLNTLFMAIGKGAVMTEPTTFKKYTGFGVCKVLAVNPNKATIKELMGFEPKEEPTYVGTQEIEGKQVSYVRISFVVSLVSELNNGIEGTYFLTYFLRNQYVKGSTSGKYQVIDEYGRTAWATKETIDTKAQVMYSNGPANISTNYRPCYVGEEALTMFIKNLVNIPNPTNYVNGAWIMKEGEELNNAICRLDEIPNYFKNNIKELKDALTLQPDNTIKVLFGVKTADEGKETQDLYTTILKGNAPTTAYDKVKKEVEDRKNHGALSNTVFTFGNLKEYNIEATDYNTNNDIEDPLAGSENPWA